MCISMIMKSYLARTWNFGLSTVALFLMSGCAAYRVPTESFVNSEGSNQEALSHWLYTIVPRHQSQIAWYDAGHWLSWSLFGNDDDGIFGEESNYKPEIPLCAGKAVNWYTRNPLHNFCFYVIGSSQKENAEYILLKATPGQLTGMTRSEIPSNFGGKGTSFFAALHGNKPFVSLRILWTPTKKSEFYLGWRERGNFGAKCILLGKNEAN